MKYQYWKWSAAIHPMMCDVWVGRYKEQLYPGRVNRGESNKFDVDTETRVSNVCFPKDDDVLQTMTDLSTGANREAFGFDVSNFIDIQFTEYLGTENGFYDFHIDSHLDQRTKMFDRKVSAVAMLSDPTDFEGGVLTLGKNEIQLSKGDVVVFPSFVIHKVAPVTKGARYTMVSWLEGPAWR